MIEHRAAPGRLPNKPLDPPAEAAAGQRRR